MTYSNGNIANCNLQHSAMPVTGNLLLVKRLITVTLYKLVYVIFSVIQRIYWQLNGTARLLREARQPQNYDRSVQVLDIVMFHTFSYISASVNDYLCTHSGFTNPQYIINNDHITLLTLTEHDAIFCEPAKRGMHLWKSEYSSFMWWSQPTFGRHLLRVPLSVFHIMSEKIGEPRGELIFLFNTTRCGSTLFTQMMEHTGRCVTVSEPFSLNVVTTRYREYGDSPEVRQLMRDVIRWECRPYPTIQPPPLAYVLKVSSPNAVALRLIRELLPSSRLLFMYRDVVAVAKSMYRVSMVMPLVRFLAVLGKLSAVVTKSYVDSTDFDCAGFCVRHENDLTMGVVMWMIPTKTYLQIRRSISGPAVAALRYEDLVARPLEMSRAIMEFCGLPVSLAELAVNGMKEDSQRNSPLSTSVIGRHRMKEPELTAESRESLNKLLTQNGFPLIGDPCILEGTIGHTSDT